MDTEKITQHYLENFPGDFSGNLMPRQTPKIVFSTVQPVGFENPKLIVFNEKLSEEIGLGKFLRKDLDFLVGNHLPENIHPYATAYAGHQFGNWAGQLGDGRAIFAGEIQNSSGKKTEIQWKGAGITPYSRFADGRAVLRSSLREYLMSEAMHHLKIPTTRALSICFTGEDVVRDIMYNGNPKKEKGAVIIRTAESFLRFGHFELLSAQNEIEILTKLADFSIENYFQEITSEGSQKYKDWFQNICKKTADLMVEWFRVGFVHGVMNTDNMSVLGLTIDYGPFAFLEEYDLNFTSNTTDLPGKRYAFGKQAQVAQWNLWQLANALFPLINDEKFLEKALLQFNNYFWEKHDEMLCRKFGFDELLQEDINFFTEWQKIMKDLELDYTLFFNKLEKIHQEKNLKSLFEDCSYSEISENSLKILGDFIEKYKVRLSRNKISVNACLNLMRKANPKFILRNYILFDCIDEVTNGSRTLLDKVLVAIENPYKEIFPEFSTKRPEKYNDRPGCSMLSCSS